MAQSIYGGRIDNEFDQRLLNTFLDRIFTTRSFDSEFKLALKVDGHKDIKMPEGIRSVVSLFEAGVGSGVGKKKLFLRIQSNVKDRICSCCLPTFVCHAFQA